VIKLPLILLFAISSEIAYCQYTYFNNVYQGNITGTYQCNVFETTNGYVSTGLEDFSVSRRRYSFDGELLEYLAFDPTNNILGSFYNSRDGFINLESGFISSYGNMLSNCFNYTEYAGYARFNENLDTIWTKTFPSWSICDTLTTGVQGFCKVSEEITAMYSIMAYSNANALPLDSIGLRITTFQNSNGEILSDHYNTLPYHSYVMRQMRYIDGYFYILGDVVFEAPNPLDYQNLLIKVNENAEIIGELEFGSEDDGWEQNPQMEIDNLGNIVLIYNYASEIEPVGLNDIKQMIEPHLAIIHPVTFSVINDFTYAMPGLNVKVRGVGNTVVKQDEQSYYLSISVISEANLTLPDTICILTKMTTNGEIIWQNIYTPPDFEEPDWYMGNAFDLIQTSDGGYLISGVSYTQYQKHWLLKLDNCGYEEPMGCPAVVDAVEQNMAEEKILLWPNPCNNILKARLPNSVKEIRIVDQTGRIVMQENVYFPNQEWNVGQLTAGVYYLQAIHMNGSSSTKMLLKN
jgi:hypothetical protein